MRTTLLLLGIGLVSCQGTRRADATVHHAERRAAQPV